MYSYTIKTIIEKERESYANIISANRGIMKTKKKYNEHLRDTYRRLECRLEIIQENHFITLLKIETDMELIREEMRKNRDD